MTRSGLIPRIRRESRLLLGSSQAWNMAVLLKARARPYVQNGSETQWFQAAKSCQNRLSLFNMICFHDFFLWKNRNCMPRAWCRKNLSNDNFINLKIVFLTESLFPFSVQCVMTAADTCMRAHLGLDTVPTFGGNCLALDWINMQIERFFSLLSLSTYKLLNIVWKKVGD